jgi:hypothetical protein
MTKTPSSLWSPHCTIITTFLSSQSVEPDWKYEMIHVFPPQLSHGRQHPFSRSCCSRVAPKVRGVVPCSVYSIDDLRHAIQTTSYDNSNQDPLECRANKPLVLDEAETNTFDYTYTVAWQESTTPWVRSFNLEYLVRMTLFLSL